VWQLLEMGCAQELRHPANAFSESNISQREEVVQLFVWLVAHWLASANISTNVLVTYK
jgi:hypothetical protein